MHIVPEGLSDIGSVYSPGRGPPFQLASSPTRPRAVSTDEYIPDVSTSVRGTPVAFSMASISVSTRRVFPEPLAPQTKSDNGRRCSCVGVLQNSRSAEQSLSMASSCPTIMPRSASRTDLTFFSASFPRRPLRLRPRRPSALMMVERLASGSMPLTWSISRIGLA